MLAEKVWDEVAIGALYYRAIAILIMCTILFLSSTRCV